MTEGKNISIIGSRDFENVEVLNEVMLKIIKLEGTPKNIVSGGAIGADSLGCDWAISNNINPIIFEPKYKDFPRKIRRWAAPKARNTTIIENSDVVVAFWDMKSTGTKDSLDKATDKGVKTYIYNTENGELIIP